MSTNELKRQSGGPMYQQLRQNLLARIRRGEFAPGSVLPSENQLCEQYGVSVTTARRAFLELVKEGVVQRKAGVGTMVAPRVRRARIAFLSIDYVGDAWRHISSVMGELIAGVGEYAWQHDATLNMLGVEDDEAATYLRGLVEDRSSDGVLLRTANDIREEHLEILEEAGMPYVVIKRHLPGRRMNYVNSDDVSGARMATSHLLELGHRRIGFVCARPHVSIGRERLAGYKEAFIGHKVEIDEELIRQEPNFTREMGHRAVESLMELPDAPTAIFVASDTMAMGGYEALQDLGLRIPEDVSVVGYDDILAAAALLPPMTTVRTSYYDFGKLSTSLLLDLIEGRESPPQQRVIQPSLMVRGSTGRKDERHAAAAVEKVKSPMLLRQTEDSGPGKLSGKVVASAGVERELTRVVTRACELEGARTVPGPDLDPEAPVDSVVFSLALRQDIGAELGRAMSFGRKAAGQLADGGGGTLLFVAASETTSEPASAAGHEAARAGLARVVGELAGEWSGNGVRVNALLSVGGFGGYRTGEMGKLAGPMLFLLLEESSSLNGETLTLGRSGALW